MRRLLDNITDDFSVLDIETPDPDTGGNTTNFTPYDERVETYLVPAVFAIIFVLGVLGNGTLVLVFVRHRSMRNVPNTYILSLALADLLVMVACVPFTATAYTVDSWPWGLAVCKLSEAVKDISIGVSVFTLTALSADRFFAVARPLKRLGASGASVYHSGGAPRPPVLAAGLIWVVAAACAAPAAIGSFLRTFGIGDRKFVVCYPFPEEWGSLYPKANVLARFLVLYAAPLTVIGMFYALMARHLVLSARNVPAVGAHAAQQRQRQARVRKKVAATVLTFVLVFALCFLPYHIFMLWFYFNPDAQQHYNAYWHYFRIFGFCMTFLNSCANPVALYCVSGTFRAHFNRYLLCGRAPTTTRSRCNTASVSLNTLRRRPSAPVDDRRRGTRCLRDPSTTLIALADVDHQPCTRM